MLSSRVSRQTLQRRVLWPANQPQPHRLAASRLVINSIQRANHILSTSPNTATPPPLSLAGAGIHFSQCPSSPTTTTTTTATTTAAATTIATTAISSAAPCSYRKFHPLHTHPAVIIPSFYQTRLSHPSPLSTRTPTPVAKIASQRSAQLARHFSSSSPSASSSPTSQTPAPAPGHALKMASPYSIRKVAAPNTLEHRVYLEKDGVPISPFHDIPLYANQEQTILNMIVEIPRWTNAKLEISKDELLNPIKQDVKKGKLRFVRNCFPHKGYLWNYGAFPQTWEDPNSIHPETKAKGDNDPLDVCEIGELVGYPGQVKQVKVLGVMALLDEEETDWKVIVVDVKDPLAPKLNDVEDVERHLPGLLRATNEWFRIYKIPDGKPENQFAFTGECKNKAYAMDVIHECAEAWEKLITGKTQPGGISTTNLTVSHSPSRVTRDQLPPIPPSENLAPEPIDSSIDKWFFISGAAA
ncbi:inorganic pyrophosphatase [Nemania serpens]|nr:inorganic pyrophosphatase [Nemania serpens]